MTRISYTRTINGVSSGVWHVSTPREFHTHTTDRAGPYKEVRQYLAQSLGQGTERSFDVLEVTSSLEG